MTEILGRKARNSLYKKNIVFVDIYNGLENKKILPEKVPLNALFVENKNMICMMSYSFSRPFESITGWYSLISFLATSAVDPKFCLLFVDLFTLKIYTNPMKKKESFSKKTELFYKDIEKKIGQNEVTSRSRI